MQYFGYLRRDPDTIGYNNWVTTLTNDPGNFRHMIFGFLFSDETAAASAHDELVHKKHKTKLSTT